MISENIEHAVAKDLIDANSKDVARLHQSAIVIDMHADTAQRLVDEKIDVRNELADGHVDAVRLKRGGVDAQFFAVWVDPHYYGAGGATAIERAERQIEVVKNLSAERPRIWQMALNVKDIKRAKVEGKIATLLALEGGYALDEKLENVERFYDLGARYLSPVWNWSLSWAGSSGDTIGRGRGLNEFGENVIREMNRLGMMIDVSHVSDKTFWDIIKVSTKPVIASHSNVRSLADMSRNLDDDMIRAIAETKGCVCVVFYPAFIEASWDELKNELQTKLAAEISQTKRDVWSREGANVALERIALERLHERAYRERLPPVSIAQLVNHIDYIVNLVGINHVGLGSDFDGIQATPRELQSAADYPNITRELARRGYADEDILKILGENMLRVMQATEER